MPLIDRTRLTEDFEDNPDTLREVIDTYRGELPHLIKTVHDAIQLQNPKNLERATHALRGAVANFHARSVRDHIKILEQLFRERRLDATAIQKVWGEVKELLTSLNAELDALLDDRPANELKVPGHR